MSYYIISNHSIKLDKKLLCISNLSLNGLKSKQLGYLISRSLANIKAFHISKSELEFKFRIQLLNWLNR